MSSAQMVITHSQLGVLLVSNVRYVSASTYYRHESPEGIVASFRDDKGRLSTVRLASRDTSYVVGVSVRQLNEGLDNSFGPSVGLAGIELACHNAIYPKQRYIDCLIDVLSSMEPNERQTSEWPEYEDDDYARDLFNDMLLQS